LAATMKDLAKLADVSVGTVSNVLTGAATVSDGVRLRVLEAAKSVGYRHNVLAADLRRGRTKTIGICIPDLSNAFFHALMRAISRCAERDNYEAIVVETAEIGESNNRKLDFLYSRRIEGLFLIPTDDWNGSYDDSMPTILLDRIREHERLPAVALDNVAASGMAVDFLYDKGHREIWLVLNESSLWNSAERRHGFMQQAEKLGIADQCSLLQEGTGVQQLAQRLAATLEDVGPPDAVISGHDTATLAVLRAFTRAGVAIPKKTSLLAYDDVAWMDALYPTISAIAQPVEGMAQAAWARMKAGIEGQKVLASTHRLLPVIIERDSTAVRKHREIGS
jgi:LacI family transcriptional regulator